MKNNGIGWCSVLQRTLVFYERGVGILEPREEYYPEVVGDEDERVFASPVKIDIPDAWREPSPIRVYHRYAVSYRIPYSAE